MAAIIVCRSVSRRSTTSCPASLVGSARDSGQALRLTTSPNKAPAKKSKVGVSPHQSKFGYQTSGRVRHNFDILPATSSSPTTKATFSSPTDTLVTTYIP
jgi:hypothetical protein